MLLTDTVSLAEYKNHIYRFSYIINEIVEYLTCKKHLGECLKIANCFALKVIAPYHVPFSDSSRLISSHFLFPLIFKFPCTMGENIRIFHIEIIYFIGCNITTVIVIIFTKSTFELFDQLIPEIRTYLDSGVSNSVYCSILGRNLSAQSGGIFFKLFFERDVLRIQDIKIVIHLVIFFG